MFASQLLRILETMPNDVKSETRVFDPAERSSSMEGGRNSKFYDSESFGREDEIEFLSFRNGAFEINCRNEHLSAESMNGFSKDNEGGTKDPPEKEDNNGMLYRVTGENGDSDSLSSETKDEDSSWRSREFECSMIVEGSKHCDVNAIQDSGDILISASSFLDLDPDSYADKTKPDFDLPDIEVCYKETNVCIDELMPVEENVLIENRNNSRSEDPEGRVGEGSVMSDGLTNPFSENMKKICGDESGGKEGKPKSQAEYKVNDALQEGTFVVSSLPIQEFGTRSFLRSFLNSLDIEENNVVRPRNDLQISFESSVVSSAEAEQKEEIEARNMLYVSQVERTSITFSFSPPAPVIPVIVNESRDLHDTGNVSDRSLDAYSSHSSSTSPVHFIINNDTSNEKGQEKSPDIKDTTSDDLSTHDRVQIFSNKTRGSPNSDGREIESLFPKHEHVNSDNVSLTSQTHYDEAYSSYSAADFITYSGPMAFSGSLSDGSTTSTRSFAFPILHSEGNRSPVRMEKTDFRHLQKHKDWRSGLLCCRF